MEKNFVRCLLSKVVLEMRGRFTILITLNFMNAIEFIQTAGKTTILISFLLGCVPLFTSIAEFSSHLSFSPAPATSASPVESLDLNCPQARGDLFPY